MNKIVDIIRLAGAFLFNKLVATSKKPAHTTDSAVEPIDDTATTATAVDKIVMNENAHVVKHSHELQVWQPVRPGLPCEYKNAMTAPTIADTRPHHPS